MKSKIYKITPIMIGIAFMASACALQPEFHVAKCENLGYARGTPQNAQCAERSLADQQMQFNRALQNMQNQNQPKARTNCYRIGNQVNCTTY